MAKIKEEKKPKYDYNIYRIQPSKYDEFVDYLEERQFESIPLKQNQLTHSDVSVTLFYCDKDNKNGLKWIELLSECTEWELEQDAKIYGAAMIYYCDDFCYISSYGNAHFYVSAFCDYNFGTDVAEHLIDLNSVKAHQNVSHGNKISKTQYDYLRNSVLTYGSGEIPHFIRGNSINPDDWGDVINCGTSAQFKWVEKPLEIIDKLILLNKVLKEPAKISLPRLIPLDDETDMERIVILNNKLATSIKEFDPTKDLNSFVNVPSFYLLGTKIIQNDFVAYKLTCDRKRKEDSGELNIQAIKDFLAEYSFDICECIDKINIQVQYGSGNWSPSQPIIKYLEFVTDDNFCLRDGKWWQFNKAYISKILNDLSRLAFENHKDDIYSFNRVQLIQYAKTKGFYTDDEYQPYETYYNQYLSDALKLKCIHPCTTKFEEGEPYRLEICDLYGEDSLYFVKVGSPGEFAYAIDQASLTLDRITRDNGWLIIDDQNKFIPKVFYLILVFNDRKTFVTQWDQIKSLNFLMHLSELNTRLGMSTISMKIEFIYETKEETLND